MVLLLTFIYSSGTLRGTDEDWRVLLRTFIYFRYSPGNREGPEGPFTYIHLAPALSGNRGDSEGPDSCYLLSSSSGTLRGTEEDRRVLFSWGQ